MPAGDADDVLQVIRLRFFRHIARVKSSSRFLAKVANTACLEHHRRARRERAALEQFALLGAPRRDPFRWTELVPISRLDIATAMSRVGQRCAELLAAIRLGEKTQKEYAEEAGVPLGTVGPAVVRCLRKMRSLLSSSYGTTQGGLHP